MYSIVYNGVYIYMVRCIYIYICICLIQGETHAVSWLLATWNGRQRDMQAAGYFHLVLSLYHGQVLK